MDTNQRKHIAEAIRAARLRMGWTVTEAARRLNTSESNWSRWETATATPRPSTMVELAGLLELPADWTSPKTLSQPTTNVDPEELLTRIRAELAEHERRIEQMFERLTGASGHDNDQQDIGAMGEQ